MSCNLASDLLEKYCDGDADVLECIVVEGHMKLCPECAAACAEMQWLAHKLRELGDSIPYPADLSALGTAVAEGLTTRASLSLTLVGVARNSSRFVQFIPGVSRATALARRGMRAAPRAAFDLTSYVVKGGARLAQALT